MATRPQKKPFDAVINGDMSGDITGTPTIIDNLTMMSYSFSWSGTSPVGTVSVEVSNDYELAPDGRTVVNAGTWNPLVLSVSGSPATTVAVSGNSGTGLIDILQTGSYAIRPVYTFTSGTGTMQVLFTGKVA